MISVVIPHKPERDGYLINTIRSINKQTFKDIEVIIIYDHNKKGASYCRNRGIEMARGEYIFPCDDDIILEPHCLEKMYKMLMLINWCYVYCDYIREGKVQGMVQGEKYNYENLKDHNYISTMSLIKKQPILSLKFDETLTRFQDWDFWLRLKKPGLYIPEALFTAYYEEDSITNLDMNEYYKHKQIIMEKNFS